MKQARSSPRSACFLACLLLVGGPATTQVAQGTHPQTALVFRTSGGKGHGFDTTLSREPGWGGAFAGWRGLSGQDRNSLFPDPLSPDPGGVLVLVSAGGRVARGRAS